MDLEVFPCPMCGGDATKALYAGIPVKLCCDMRCACLWGSFSNLVVLLAELGLFDGWFIRYNSYWGAMWYFLTKAAK